MQTSANQNQQVTGNFVTLNGERYYAINHVDNMAPFFISLISDSDHWLFISSNGGLTAGRVSPETALFPYETADKIHDNHPHTGCKTLIRKYSTNGTALWEPFNKEHQHRYNVSRNLYKTNLGHKLCFEEINHDLELTYRYFWETSDKFGFVRHCELVNNCSSEADVSVLDGFQNLLPAGTPRYTQANSSNLVDAYKWTELEPNSGLGIFSLFSGITDRAEPCESLHANTVFSLGLERTKVLLSNEQIEAFKLGQNVEQDSVVKGIRAAYLVQFESLIAANSSKSYQFVANIEQSQPQIVELLHALDTPDALMTEIQQDIAAGGDGLARKMAAADGFQSTEEETVSAHHYANVLFNVLRGGIFDDQYVILSSDYIRTIKHFNADVYEQHSAWLHQLANTISYNELLKQVDEIGCPQLQRLTMEYLPITFGRRHGDPSRPWNQFEIKLLDDEKQKILSYQGNWRDIFQNWEALTFSYPEFIESVIAKFVNASTVDGYNPYRITKQGIDWEVEEPDDPWSYIGYWGDHQIIYLQKLLELSHQFHPNKLTELLRKDVFSYANVPYRIKSFADIKQNAKSTVTYDNALADKIDEVVASKGADGKLILDQSGQVYQVNLIEKLSVALLAKLGNLILGGGIWLNTQRPEWNDANNALVGQGVSVVTLCYMRRYVEFMLQLLSNEKGQVSVSSEVAQWLQGTRATLANAEGLIASDEVNDESRFQITNQLGELAWSYRDTVYQQTGFSAKEGVEVNEIIDLLHNAKVAIDYTIAQNQRQDGLYHAYNLLSLNDDRLEVDYLYPMLEGQVAALSSGALDAPTVNNALDVLFSSDVFRPDQHTFMLYPDRQLPSFLNKNKVPSELANSNELIAALLQQDNHTIVVKDANGDCRFNGKLTNADRLQEELAALPAELQMAVERDRGEIFKIYETVFNHKAFTGRSGGMFGFEGLGSIYWHMVSKLLLAVQECYFNATDNNADADDIQRLANHYYQVRQGIGFNKTPSEYGAFPVDPYSHTPKHSGAQQPGMTGQVKEEVLTRFGELGLRVRHGQIKVQPSLLRVREFNTDAKSFTYLNINNEWQNLELEPNSLAFTWCQVPIVYRLVETKPGLTLNTKSGQMTSDALLIDSEMAQSLFKRDGIIESIYVDIPRDQLSSIK